MNWVSSFVQKCVADFVETVVSFDLSGNNTTMYYVVSFHFRVKSPAGRELSAIRYDRVHMQVDSRRALKSHAFGVRHTQFNPCTCSYSTLRISHAEKLPG